MTDDYHIQCLLADPTPNSLSIAQAELKKAASVKLLLYLPAQPTPLTPPTGHID
jgi:hypothetical protein